MKLSRQEYWSGLPCLSSGDLPDLGIKSGSPALQAYFLQSEPPGKTNKCVAAAAKSLQSCPTLCDPIDGSPPGSPVPGILQARTLEWVAISFSSVWKWKVKGKSLSRVRPSATPWTAAYQAPPSMDFPGKSTGVGCHCLLWINVLLNLNTERLRDSECTFQLSSNKTFRLLVSLFIL